MTDVVGAGGIGCCVGYAMLAAGEPVRFVEADSGKVESGNRRGVSVVGRPALAAEFIHFDDWRPRAGDTAILCVKCYDNAAVLAKAGDGVAIVPVQNGYDELLENRGYEMEGIASFVAKCEAGSTQVKITRPGTLYLGSRGGSGDALRFASRLRTVLTTKTVNDIRPIKATKLMYNAAISPLAAAAGVDNGALLTDTLARTLFFSLLRENYSILTRAGIPPGKVGPFHPHTVSRILSVPGLARLMARFFVRSLRGTYCSMAGDIERGRTELANYTGHLLRLDRAAKLNRIVMDVVSGLKKPDRGVLETIARAYNKGQGARP